MNFIGKNENIIVDNINENKLTFDEKDIIS